MPRHQLSANSADRPAAPRLSIRARLMLLALLAVVPLTLDRVRLLETSRAERLELAASEVLDLARRGADAQLQVINSTRAMLQVVARAYIALAHDGQTCTKFLAGFVLDVPWIKGLSVVGPNGRIMCSTRRTAVGLDVSDREYIHDAQRTWDFVMSDYLIARGDHKPAIIAAYPTMAKDDSVDTIILASVDLQWFTGLASLVEERPGASIMLLDRNATVLEEFPNGGMVGKNFAEHPLSREIFLRTDGAATATTTGYDGVRRIFAFMRLAHTNARILIGLDEAEVLSRIDREIGIAYLQLGLFGILILLAAWFGGERLIVEPIRALARAAARIGRGDLDVRPDRERWALEFAPLASALSDMAARLSERDREMRSANRHLEALASIDSLSGLANRRSFDARLAAEWQRAHKLEQPVALMMIDVDHFKLFNDNYGHLEGDECLRRIAKTLSALTVGNADFAARYGGEEFVLLLPDTVLATALDIAEQLRIAVLGLDIVHRWAPLGRVTISVGLACLTPSEGSSPQDLIEAADAGLYAAKRRGRNVVAIEQPALLPAA
jgi:diguanylate cyclase (GGDEF)-like protein